MSEIVLTTFPLGLCEIEGGIHILNCACPHLTPPPHGSLIPVDAIKPAFTNPVQTMIYLHYRWNLTDFITGKCRWTDEQWEEFLKRPLEALQVKRHRRSLSDLFGYLGFGMSAMNTLAIGQETGKRRAQVSKTADLLEKTHEQMIRMAASSFLLEDAQKVKTLTVVVDAFGKTTDVLAEMTSRDQMLALCLHRASLDIEDTRMFLRDLTHHHLPPLLREEIDKRLPIGIKVIPQRTTHLVENPVLKVTNYELQLKVSMIIYTGTPLGDVHEHHYIGHAVGLTTMPEQVPTNGTHVIKTVCISDDQSLICQTPIKWITIDEWADQTPQSMTNKTWDVVTLTGDICVNTPILQYADLTCTLDKPACFSPKVMWLAPHGALVPPIKIDYNTTTRITRPQSPVDEALMAELSGIAQELAEKVSRQEEKHAVILHKHHALTNDIIKHTEVLKEQAHKLVVQIKQEKWWDLFRVDASPMGVVRLCVAVLICSVPFLWICNVCLLCLECKMMRKRVSQVPKLTMAQFRQYVVRSNLRSKCRVSVDLDINQVQHLKASVDVLQLPVDVQRAAMAATLPTECCPHVDLTCCDGPVRRWIESNPGSLGRKVALKSVELQITPKGIGLVFDGKIEPLDEVFALEDCVPFCAWALVPGYTEQSLGNHIRDNDEKLRHPTTTFGIEKIGSDSYAIECKHLFQGIVKLHNTEAIV